ncbi:MAG: hypothetical protein JSU04_15690 [Bdellovibrionales bacterium]|nr:hypothetical protein [Bdellovibrionales bacterium]
MKTVLSLASVLVLLVSCAHKSAVSERTPAQTQQVALPLKPEEITVWSLQTLAQSGRLDILNDLFNNYGLPITQLPTGYAAGTGARVFDLGTPLFAKLLDDLTGANWRGKIFYPSENPVKSMGLNRIKQTLVLKTAITPMASFVTEIHPKHPLVPDAKSAVVTLNYAKPVTKNYWQELALTQIEVYDVMVPVQGKYGPIFIGKTWLGSYAKDRSFRTKDPNQLIAWFFLDFNAEALAVQQREHWDGAKENVVQVLPRMTEKSMPVMPPVQ